MCRYSKAAAEYPRPKQLNVYIESWKHSTQWKICLGFMNFVLRDVKHSSQMRKK